jgi:choline dehydrogenase-like flavoprotein
VIIDYLDSTSPDDVEADLCIVGAGAAGIAIARSFIGTTIRVCLVEGGGIAGEERSQSLYNGESIGSTPFDTSSSRMRVFGGSCKLWGGGCITFSRHDLEPRDWVPDSGWPLDYDELEPWYGQARNYLGIDAHDFTDGSFLTPPARTPCSFDEDTLVNPVFARSPMFFGEHYRAQLDAAENIMVVLHANLMSLEATPDGASVDHARIGSMDGRRGRVTARQYVLAAGGIENARLLLLSDSVSPDGLGNAHGLVGRYFMDHPSGKLGVVATDDPDALTRPYERHIGKDPAPVSSEIALSAQAQRDHRMLAGRVHPFPIEGKIPFGVRALREFRAALKPPVRDEAERLEIRMCEIMRNGPMLATATPAGTPNLGMLALRVGLGTGDIVRAFAKKLADRPTVRSNHVELIGYFEQAPNSDSRIMLGSDTDALGLRKVSVDWQLSAIDRHTIRTAARLFGEQLARACNGRFEPEPWVHAEDDAPLPVHGTAHHLGTTRMATRAEEGVVDRDCRVHGMSNLHVAGSSVFPTGGWAFPTFTIVALSLRLAAQLQVLLADCSVTAIV